MSPGTGRIKINFGKQPLTWSVDQAEEAL
jgi:hypothetical protein